MGVSINLPNVEQAEVLEFTFEVDGQPVTVPIPVAPGIIPSPDELARVAYETEVGLWVRTQDWFQDWVDYATNAYLEADIASGIADRFGAQSFLTLLSLYQDKMNTLGEAMANRVRFYRPELVEAAADDYTLMLDAEAIDTWVKADKIKEVGKSLVRDVAEHTLVYLVCWALDQRPADEAELLQLVAVAIRRYGDDVTERAVWNVIQPAAERTIDPSLEQLEKILGLTLDVPRSALVLPVGAGAVGIGEGLTAAADNNWSISNGLVSYQTPVDDLLVSLTVTDDGVHPTTIVERALDTVAQFDPLAARLHTYLSTVAERQPRPWLDPFMVDTDEAIEVLNLGRLGRVRKSNQVDQVVRSLRCLSKVLVALEWVDDPDYEGSYSNLWTIDEYRVRRGRDPETKLPYRYEIEVRPGHWSRLCLAKNALRAVYAPTAVLTRRDGLALDLLRWYVQTPSTQFLVRDWLAGAMGPTVDRVSDRHYRAKLHKRFDAAIAEIRHDLDPGFDLVESGNWLESQVVKQTTPVRPVTAEQYVSELQRLRKAAGMTQGELGRLAHYPQAQVSRAENHPEKHKAITDALIEVLMNMNKTVIQNIRKP